MTYETPGVMDVWGALGRPGTCGSEAPAIAELIRRAERKLRLVLRGRGLDWDVIAEDELKGPYLRDLVIEAVARVERSEAAKAGLKSESEGSYSYTLASGRDVSTNLWWPEDDLRPLGGAGGRTRVGTIRLNRVRRDW